MKKRTNRFTSTLAITAFVQQIGEAFQEIGFLALKGHFLDAVLQEQLYREIRSFFELPSEIKSSYEVKDGGGQRGYTGFGKEHAAGRTVGDLKEFWHFGQDLNNKPFLKDNNIDAVPVEDSPLKKLIEELPFDAKDRTVVKN